MSAELRVDRLVKSFSSGRAAVDDVSFRVAPGEIIVLLGPSGCGKTTTLRCIAGLEHPTSGEIAIAGAVVSAPERGVLVPPRLRNLGMVFQSYAVWPHMTVRQNVSYPLRHRRMPRTEIARKVDEVLELVGLSEYAERSVVALSGGQMQRVALARSLAYDPQLLLLDEPLSNLDAKLRLRLRDDLRRIVKDAGVTAVYVTHDQAEAVVLGDRIGVMRDGKMLQIAAPADIYNRPADLFVANFTGASHHLAGRVVERKGEFGTVEVSSGDRLRVWLPPGVGNAQRVQLAIRPENVLLGAFSNGEPNRFMARVMAQHFHGAQTVYELAVLGGHIEAIQLGTNLEDRVGTEVEIALPPSLCWGYPAEEPTVRT